MKYIVVLFILFPFINAYAKDNIVIYRMDAKDQTVWSVIKKSFDTKDYNVSIYDKTENMDRHIENLNRINRSNALLMLAMDFRLSDRTDIFIAVSESEKTSGRLLTLEQVTGHHSNNSTMLAKEIASSFGKNLKKFSVFPLLGVDMPGTFVKIECKNEQMNEMLDKLHGSIQKYLKRGNRDEK